MRRLQVLFVGLLVLVASVAVASSDGAAEARWAITDLGTVGEARGINARGQIVGFDGRSRTRAFLWDKGKLTHLGPNRGEGKQHFTFAIAINERGQVVVQQGEERVAHVWEDGELKALAPLGDANSSDAYAINDAGLIVGRSKSTRGVWPRAVAWIGTHPFALPMLAGGRMSEALAVNNRGVVVGWSNSSRGGKRAVLWRTGRVVPLGGSEEGGTEIPLGVNERDQVFGLGTSDHHYGVVWTKGRAIDLGTLGGWSTNPYAMNNRGQIIGQSLLGAETNEGWTWHAFLWERGRMRDLGALGDRENDSIARDINDRGQVVGDSEAGRYGHAFVWEKGRMTDLGTLPGSTFSSAHAINEQGQIVGSSMTKGGELHAVLWTLKR